MQEETAKTVADYLLACYSGTNEAVSDATNYLTEFKKDINSIFVFFEVLQNNPNNEIKKAAAVQIMQMIRKNQLYENENLELVERIKSVFMECLTSEALHECLLFVAHAADELLLQKPQMWEAYVELCMHFISEDATILIGFEIFSEICQSLGEEFNNEHFQFIIQRFSEALSSENSEIRDAALKLMFVFSQNVNPELFTEQSGIIDLLVNEARNSLSLDVSQKNEATHAFDLLSHLTQINIPLFDENQSVFYELAVEIAETKEIPIEMRSVVQQLLVVTPLYVGEDDVEEQFPAIVSTCLDFFQELYNAGEDIQYMALVIDTIMRTGYITTDIIQSLMETASEAVTGGDTSQLYVILMALSGVPAYGGEELTEVASEDILELIGTCINSDSSDIFQMARALTDEIAKYAHSLYNDSLDALVELYIDHIGEERAIETLSLVLSNADYPYSQYQSLIQELVNLIGQSEDTAYSSIIFCISSALSKVENDQEMYELVSPALAQLLETTDEDLKCAIFECFSSLIRLAPLKAAEEIEQLMTVLIQSFSEYNDKLNENIALCISQIAKSLPNSIKPFVGNILPAFDTLMNKPLPGSTEAQEIKETKKDQGEEEDQGEAADEDDEDEDEDPTTLMIAAVIKSYSTIINEIATDIADSIPPFIEKLVSFIEGPTKIQMHAVKAVFLLYDGLAAISYDESHLYTVLIDMLQNCTELSIASELFLSIGGLFISYGPSMSDENIESALNIFQGAFNGELSVLYSGNTYIDPDVYSSLFFALRMFIFSLGEKLPSVADKIVEFLSPHTSGNKKVFVGYVLHSLAAVVYTHPAIEEIPEIISQQCFKELNKSKLPEYNNLLLSAINMLVSAKSSVFTQDQVQKLLSYVNSTISGTTRNGDLMIETCVTLWCSIVVHYGLTPAPQELATILGMLPPPVDDDDIPFVATFFVYAMQHFGDVFAEHIPQIGINVLASGTWLIRIINPEILAQITAVIREIPDEEKLMLLKGNQHSLNQVMFNIQQFS